MANRYPDTIEIRFKNTIPTNDTETLLQLGNSTTTNLIVELDTIGSYETQGNVNLYIRSGSTYTSTSLSGSHIYDNEYNQLFIERSNYDDDSLIDQTYSIHLIKQKNGIITYNNSTSIFVEGSLGLEYSVYNDSWNVDNTLYIAYANNPINTNYFTGNIQEVRFWHKTLTSDIKIQHALNGESYAGNEPTSSYSDLISRIPLNDVDVELDTNSYINSIHPKKEVTTTVDLYLNRASMFGLTQLDYKSSQETYYQTTPNYGPNIYDSDKVEFVEAELLSDLSPTKRVENTNETRYEIPSNKVRVALSPTDIVNNDIFSHTGYFAIDDYIGNPEDTTNDKYTDLYDFSKQYWKKYSKINSAEAYFNILKIFDYSIFQQIKQVLPARGDNLLGVIYEPNILERPKQRVYRSITNELTTTDVDLKLSPDEIQIDMPNDIRTSIPNISNEISAEYKTYHVKVDNDIPKKISSHITYQFYMDFNRIVSASSTYNRQNLVWNGDEWVYIDNSNQIRESVIEDISSYTVDGHYNRKKYKFDSDLDIYAGTYSSYSFVESEIKEIYSTPTKNRNYNGCQLFNYQNKNYSYPTPDNKPVIEEFDVSDDAFNGDFEIDGGSNNI